MCNMFIASEYYAICLLHQNMMQYILCIRIWCNIFVASKIDTICLSYSAYEKTYCIIFKCNKYIASYSEATNIVSYSNATNTTSYCEALNGILMQQTSRHILMQQTSHHILMQQTFASYSDATDLAFLLHVSFFENISVCYNEQRKQQKSQINTIYLRLTILRLVMHEWTEPD